MRWIAEEAEISPVQAVRGWVHRNPSEVPKIRCTAMLYGLIPGTTGFRLKFHPVFVRQQDADGICPFNTCQVGTVDLLLPKEQI